MNDVSILWPMFAMINLIFFVGITMLRRRIRVVNEGFDWRYYITFEGEKPPRDALQADQHFVNLFEVPVLFYTACLTVMILDSLTEFIFALAWMYVLGRVLHAYISLTHNRLLWRSRVFVGSGLVLFSMWILITYQAVS